MLMNADVNVRAGRQSELPRVQGTQEQTRMPIILFLIFCLLDNLLSPGQVGEALPARAFTPLFFAAFFSAELHFSQPNYALFGLPIFKSTAPWGGTSTE